MTAPCGRKLGKEGWTSKGNVIQDALSPTEEADVSAIEMTLLTRSATACTHTQTASAQGCTEIVYSISSPNSCKCEFCCRYNAARTGGCSRPSSQLVPKPENPLFRLLSACPVALTC